MELTKKQFDVLWAIEEGMKWMNEIQIVTHFDDWIIKGIMEDLEKMGLINLERRFDEAYKEDNWVATSTEKAKEVMEKHDKWMPKDELKGIEEKNFSISSEY